jgi:hypothetical protein
MSRLKAGTLNDYKNSMAEEMEKALLVMWPQHFDGTFPESQKEQFRVLILALAQGIVNHLMEGNVFTIIHPTGTELRMNAQGITLKVGGTRMDITSSGVDIS